MQWAMLAAAVLFAGCKGPEGAMTWRGDCQFVDRTTDWHKLEMTVPTREYRTIRLYLRLQRATGTVWFDRVEAEGIKVLNPSFEQTEGHRIAHWGQDDIGETIFVDSTRAMDGKRSVRITRTRPGQSRIWQDLRVEPGKRYKIRVWAQWQNIVGGHGYGEIYGVKPNGSLGGILTSTQRLAGSSKPVVDRWWEMGVRAGRRAEARCEVDVEEPGTYEFVVAVDTSRLDGRAAVELRGASGSISRAELGRAADWQTVRLCGKIDRRATAVVRASGNGTVRLRAPELRHLDIVPWPQQVRWLAPSENFALRGRITIVVPPDTAGPQLTGPSWLAREIRAKCGAAVKVLRTAKFDGRAIYMGGELARRKLAAAGLSVPARSEGYAVAVRRDFVAAAGQDERGTFYAAVTLLWLLQKIGDGAELVAADIVDWPDLPFRGTYGFYGGTPAAAAETCARLKLNAIVLEHGDWYHLDSPKLREKWQKAAAVMRQYYIDFIPEMQSFGHGGAVLSVDCRCVEAEWIQGEKHVLRGTEPVELKRRDVIVTEATRIEVTSADGKTRYQEGRDFRVIPGETAWPFSPKHRPWKIARVAGGRIPDGATVLVSYDCAPKRGSSYCPNEPLVYEIMGRAIRNTMRLLRPRFLHIGHDEIYRMNTDSRCRRAGRSNAENLAMELKRLLGFAREVDPKVKLMLWADMINPYHNGRRLHASDPCYKAAELIPPEGFIMNVWFYGATQPRTVGWQSLKWFDERGFATTGSPWYNHTCAALWGDVCALARRRGMNCIGALYTSWSARWNALATMADHAWHAQPVEVEE